MSKKIRCPKCNGKVNIEDDFCIHCGFALLLRNSFKDIRKTFADAESRDFDEENFPITNFLKSIGCSLQGMLIDETFRFLYYLGMSDEILHDKEIAFINYIFSTNWTKNEIIQLINSYDDSRLSLLPNSFKVLYEISVYTNIYKDGKPGWAEILLDYFLTFGTEFIDMDNKRHENEVNLLSSYINALRSNLDNYYQNGYSEEVNSLNSNKKDAPNKTTNKANGTLQEELEKLNSLVGLEAIKTDVNSLINLIHVRRLREQRGMEQPPMSLHLVFSGNPGTGKTTVARILSKIYYEMGLLSKGHLIETDRSGLVAGYIGHTAPKVKEVVQEAMGGILFIDEAYTLSSYKSEQDFGQEAIDTLLKEMEDHRDDLIVIVAGYPDLMQEFIQSNPGLQSRFNKYMFFEDYNAEELYGIFKSMCDKNHFILEDKADEYIKSYFVEMYNNRGDNFGNGRDVRNFFEKVYTKQASRVGSNLNISDEELNTLKYEDFI